MHRRPVLAVALATTLTLSSCSVVEDLTSTGADPAPKGGAQDLLVESVSTGTEWQPLDGEQLETAVADFPEEGTASVDPEEYVDAALVTDDEDGNRADIAGRAGRTDDGTALPVLAVVVDGRSVEDLREAREDCLEATVTADGYTSEQREEVRDGPDIDGADESFELEGLYEMSTDDGAANSLERYGIVAEVRGVLVVVMANPDSTAEDSSTTHPINDETRAALEDIASAQVAEIRDAD